MATNLTWSEYSASDKKLFRNFECGENDYEVEISDWIQNKYPGCVSDDLKSGKVDAV